jgi:hypothetical protein
MNNTFDWNRFCKVVNKDFRNLWPMFGTSMIVLATLPFAVWLLSLVISRDFVIDPNYRVTMIMGVSSLAAVMLPSRLYRTMNLRNEGIYYAMLPASKLEKFLSILLYTFVVAPVLVYLGSMVLDIILRLMPTGAYHQWLWQGDGGFPLFTSIPMDDDVMPGFHSWLLTAATYTSLFATPAIFLFAATLFKKHKVLYTFLILYLMEFAFTIIAIPIVVSLIKNPYFMEWFYDTIFKLCPENMMNWAMGIATGFNVVIFALFTWLTWHRLKKMPY